MEEVFLVLSFFLSRLMQRKMSSVVAAGVAVVCVVVAGAYVGVAVVGAYVVVVVVGAYVVELVRECCWRQTAVVEKL